MKRIVLFLLFCCMSFAVQAQKKKGKTTPAENYDSTAVPVPPSPKSKGKGKSVNYDSTGVPIPSAGKTKGKSKGKTHVSQVITDYVMPEPKPDTAKNFIGIIKYKETSDDPAYMDSIIIIFGRDKIRVRRFTEGYLEGQFFESGMIANFTDSTLTILDIRNHTYTTEKLSDRTSELNIMPTKKTMAILNNNCAEYAGTLSSEELGEAETACLLSPNHYFNYSADYNFLGFQPIVVGYQIVLGFRSKDDEGGRTFIMAYKIEPGNTDPWFDLSQYTPKK